MQKQIIIYPQDNGLIALIQPAYDCGLSIVEIAQKDVPQGKPYLILNLENIPQSFIFFEAWEANFDNPHGHGVGAETWFKNKGVM